MQRKNVGALMVNIPVGYASSNGLMAANAGAALCSCTLAKRSNMASGDTAATGNIFLAARTGGRPGFPPGDGRGKAVMAVGLAVTDAGAPAVRPASVSGVTSALGGAGAVLLSSGTKYGLLR